MSEGLLHAGADDPARLEADLPAATVQCHAANLMPLRDGSLACVWFGGTQEGVADIAVWFSRLPQSASRGARAARSSTAAAISSCASPPSSWPTATG